MVIEPGLVNESEPEVRREERTRRLGLFVGIDSPNKYLIFYQTSPDTYSSSWH